MIRRPPVSTRTDTRLHSTTLFRSALSGAWPRLSQYPWPDRQFHPAGRLRLDFDRRRPGPLASVAAAHHGGQLPRPVASPGLDGARSEEHTSELQSLMRISYAVFCLTKNTTRVHTKTVHS